MVKRQFDVFVNPNPSSSRDVPWLLVVQSDLLDEVATQVVVPLVRPSHLGIALTRLNPSFKVGGQSVVMLTQQIGSVRTSSLKKRAGNLESRRHEIVAAIDFLLGGV